MFNLDVEANITSIPYLEYMEQIEKERPGQEQEENSGGRHSDPSSLDQSAPNSPLR